MSHITKSIILATITTLFSCRGERWDDDLTLPKQNFIGNQLKIEGYYYSMTDNNNYQIFFFYRNGTVLDAGIVTSQNLNDAELTFANGVFYSSAINYKHDWGRFIISGTVIKREYWIPNTGPLEAHTSEGIILNDSTFKMIKSYRSCKPKKIKEFETLYHFKKFSPKPDSTNRYTN